MKKLLLIKTMLLLCALVAGSGMTSVSADTSTVTASKVTSSSVTWTGSANETWSVSVNGGATNQNVTGEYAQVGTRNSPSTSITFSTSGISGTISSIAVDCASHSGVATLSATVGGAAFGTQSQSTPTWSNNTGGEVTFTGSASGAIVITMTNGSGGRAMYIKSITVTYSTSSGGGGSTPTLSADQSSLSFTYVSGGSAAAQDLTIEGENLEGDITVTLAGANFAISEDGTDWSQSTLSIAEADAIGEIKVRLNPGITTTGEYNGTITLNSDNAEEVIVYLTGNVTNPTYAINLTQPNNAGGSTIEASKTSAEAGETITLTAHPATGYSFGTWTVLDGGANDVTVTNNQFTMPASEVEVEGSFAQNNYTITVSGTTNGTVAVTNGQTTAHYGDNISFTATPDEGYRVKSYSVTGTDVSVDGNTYSFSMPASDVTITLEFEKIPEEYSGGTFTKYTGALTEGYYIITYGDSYVLNNSISDKNRFNNGTFPTVSNNIISDPTGALKAIVWHIEANGNYWTIYNDDAQKYAAGTNTKNQGALISEVTNLAKWTVTISNGAYEFENLGRSQASSDSGNKWLRNNGTNGWACYASSTGGALTLYKYTVLTERTITFDGNGGTCNDATTYTQTVNEGLATPLTANQFTHANSNMVFVGWSTTQNGSVEYADEASITVNADLTLYAQWNQSYTAMVDDQIANGTVAIVTAEGNEDIIESVAGTEITLTYTASTGYVFDAWNVYKDGDPTTTVTVTNNKFTMPSYDVIVSANFLSTPTYTLVTNSITPGKRYIIASGTDGTVKAMGPKNANSTNRTGVSVEANDGVIPETAGVQEFVIYGPDANGNYTIYDPSESGYLYAASSDNNYLKTQNTNDTNGKWSISIDPNDGEATLVAMGGNTRRYMRYNDSNNNTLFSCYGENSSVTNLVYLFKKDDEAVVPTTASVTLNDYGYATFASTSALDFLDYDKAAFSAWKITGISGETITFSQINSHVEAGTGILLKGTANATVNLNILPVGGETLDDNMLEGVIADKDITADGEYYGLSGYQFKKVKAGTVHAGKALLPSSEVGEARQLTFIFEDATGISGITNDELRIANGVYDLQGRRVSESGISNSELKPGLYIVNGKKVLVK